MKYIVEVLQPASSSGGRRTQVYPKRDDAIAALDNYNYHRPGQPVVCLYKEDGEVKALIAVGTGTGKKDYYIIGGEDKTINNYISKISAKNIVLDSIDITELLSETGPGQEFQENREYQPLAGNSRHFGWLGTQASAGWSVFTSGSSFKTYPNLTVQEMFEAILCGYKVNRDGEAPEPVIELSFDKSSWKHELTMNYTPGTPQDVWVRLTLPNIDNLDSSITFDVNPSESWEADSSLDLYNYIKAHGEYVYKTTNFLYTDPVTNFTLTVSHNVYGSGTDTARLIINVDSGSGEDSKSVETKSWQVTGTSTSTTYSVLLFGEAINFDPLVKEIKIRREDEETWHSTSPYPGGDMRNFVGSYNLCEYGVTYYYKAIARDSSGEYEGEEHSFKVDQPGDINCRFSYYASPEEAGVVVATIDGVQVTSGGDYPIGDGTKRWKCTKTDNDPENYEFYYWQITDGVSTYTIYGDVAEGDFKSNTEVIAVYRRKDVDPDEDPTFCSVEFQVVLNGVKSSPKTDWTTYVSIQGDYTVIVTGSDPRFTVTANEGYSVVGWSMPEDQAPQATNIIQLNNVQTSQVIYIWVNQTDKFTVYANCIPLNAASMTIDGQNTNIKQYDLPHNIQVGVGYTANSGYTFEKWEIDGVEDTTDNNPYSYNIPSNKPGGSVNIIAYFTSSSPTPPPTDKYTLVVTSGSGGTISPYTVNRQVDSEYTDGITYTATPNQYYEFVEWLKGSSTYSTTPSMQIEPVTSNVTYTAQFRRLQYTLTFETDVLGIGFNSSATPKTLDAGSTFSSFPTVNSITGGDPNSYTIEYWYKKGDPNHTHVTQITVEENATYVAHLEEHEPVIEKGIEFAFIGSDNESWNDACLTFNELKGVNVKYDTVLNPLWADYNDRSSNIGVHIPIVRGWSLTKNSDDGLKTYIRLNGKTVKVYTWTGSEWKEDQEGFNNQRFGWRRIEDDTYMYYVDSETDYGQETIVLKIEE